MSDTWDGSEACKDFLAIILDDVAHPNLRRMLESLIRRGDVQKACILKEFWLQHND